MSNIDRSLCEIRSIRAADPDIKDIILCGTLLSIHCQTVNVQSV